MGINGDRILETGTPFPVRSGGNWFNLPECPRGIHPQVRWPIGRQGNWPMSCGGILPGCWRAGECLRETGDEEVWGSVSDWIAFVFPARRIGSDSPNLQVRNCGCGRIWGWIRWRFRRRCSRSRSCFRSGWRMRNWWRWPLWGTPGRCFGGRSTRVAADAGGGGDRIGIRLLDRGGSQGGDHQSCGRCVMDL